MTVTTVADVAAAAAALAAASSPVVVIPVHDSYDNAVRCLESVLAHTGSATSVLVVDDAGRDRRLVDRLTRLTDRIIHQVLVLEHSANEGFVRSCNDAFAATPGLDVVLVNSDVVVGPGWLERMVEAAGSSDLVATVTALTNHGSIVSVPYRNHPVRTLPAHLSVDEAARRIAAGSLRLRPPLPTGVGHCLLIRRAVLDLIGPFDETFTGYGEEVDFCQRAVAHGFRHIAADDVFVLHRGGASFGDRRDVLARRARNEHLLRVRHPWFEPWVRRVERDRASDLARAVAAAHRSLLGHTVGIDALCLGPGTSGTQVNTVETIRALAGRPEIDRLVAFVPFDTPAMVRTLQAELPTVDFVGIRTLEEVPEGIVDVLYRPYQVREPAELVFLHRAGERFVVNQLDTIAFDNPAYFDNHDSWSAHRDLTRMTFELAGGIAFLSEHARTTCREAGLGQVGQPSAVVSYGTDHPLTATVVPVTGVAGDAGFLLAVGASYRHKNRDFTLRVWAELRRRGWAGRLVLAGPTPPHGHSRADEAEHLLGEPDLRVDVIDLGEVTEGQERWLYENATLVLYPSTVEGFGIVPFEAARHGTPTLCSRRGSLTELLGDDTPALDGFDPVAAADLAWKLVHDKAAAAALTAALAERAADHTWSGVAERLVALFHETLRQPRPRVHGDGDDEGGGEGGDDDDGKGAGAVPVAVEPVVPFRPTAGSRWLENLVQGVSARPTLKRMLSPDGSRRQQAARDVIEAARRRLR